MAWLRRALGVARVREMTNAIVEHQQSQQSQQLDAWADTYAEVQRVQALVESRSPRAQR